MPFISTLGAAAEFRQGYITPFPVTNANVTRIEGYNVNVAFTPNTTNTGTTVTYLAVSNTGNFIGNSTSNVITVNNIDPFFTYTFDVIANGGAGGNSLPTTTTNNVYMSSNLVANGNVTVANAVAFDMSPDGTNLHCVTSVGRFLRYSRNTSTGQLTLLGNSTISGFNTFNDITFSADGNYAYITGGNTSNNFTGIIRYIMANGNTSIVGNVGNVFGSRNIIASPDNKSIFTTGRYSNLVPFTLNYERNVSTGNLSLYQSAFVSSIPNLSAATNLVEMLVTQDNKSLLQIWQNPADDRYLFNYDRNTSNTYCTNQQSISLGTQLAAFYDLSASKDNKSVYTVRSDGINLFSRNTSTGTLTYVSTLAVGNNPYSVEMPANSIMLAYDTTFYRNLSNGTLTEYSNSASYTITANNNIIKTVVSPDSNNFYALTGNRIAIFNISS